jgi:hypothetical protein
VLRPKIAYLIRAHKNPSQIERLFHALYHPEHYYLVHIDRGAEAACHRMAARLAEGRDNAWVLPSRNLCWGGYSLVETDLRAIERLAAIEDWTHFLNVSGQCYPLVSTDEIVARLAQHPDKSFVEWFDPLGSEHWPDALERLRRVCLELPWLRRRLIVPKLSINRDFMLRGDRWYGGSAWVILTREAALYTVSPATAHIRRFLRTTLSPAESLFQTALCNSHLAETIINDDLRYIKWDGSASNPEILTVADDDALRASGMLFARKFDPTLDAEILARLDARLADGDHQVAPRIAAIAG